MSSDDIAIRVRNLSKSYQIYETPRDRLKQFVLPRLQRMARQIPKQYYREFRALNDVSFDVRKGETVGIVGRNGAGKSTLLQIICGTLTPSGGTVETKGRIAALLELGSGFNPDFTGRENVHLNASVLGLSEEEIEMRFDDIAAFADIGDFIDQPVKTYSSGMVVRLAFAVAINVDPDILIIDEALSVGDELFQRKCISRIEVIRAVGATILFVSHAGNTIIELCDRAVLMDGGELLISGAAKAVIGKYQRLLYAPSNKRGAIRTEILTYHSSEFESLSTAHESRHKSSLNTDGCAGNTINEQFDPHLVPKSTIEYESCGALISKPVILNRRGDPVNCLVRGNTYRYVYDVAFTSAAASVRFGMMIKTQAGVELGGGASAVSMQTAIPYVERGTIAHVEFSFECNLNQGVYFLNAGVVGALSEEETYLHRVLDAYAFRVMPDGEGHSTGTVDFKCMPEIVQLSCDKSHRNHA